MTADSERHNRKLPDRMERVAVAIDTRRFNRNLLLVLVAFEIFLVIFDATINYQGWIAVSGIRRLANIAREDGLGTWFMVVQTLFTGLTAFLVYLVARADEAMRRDRGGWLFLAGFFSFMAIDDAAQVHERLGSAFRHYAETGSGMPGRVLEFFPSYPWQLILVPFFAAAGVFMLVFLWSRLRYRSGRLKLVLALAFFVTALALDFLEGLEPGSRLNIYFRIIDNTSLGEDFVLHFAKVIEEFLEMLAMTLLFSMFFIHLSRSVKSLSFSFISNSDTRR
ncbi:MAG: hypothetical protein ACYC5A_08360 [Thermoleophilia bacterium]